ncbi:hypothetical protein D9M68_984520 [compost metagenome]
MEAVQSGNDLVLFVPAGAHPKASGEFECRLVRLGAGVGEEDLVSEGRLRQRARQAKGWFIGENV